MKTRIEGLKTSQVQISRTKFGSNALEKRKGKSMLGKFLENLSDPIIRVLLIATILRMILSFGDCNWFEIGGIILAVFIASAVTTISEWGSERAFEKMQQEEKDGSVRALRDGELIQISVNDVVVGDVLHVSAGENIVADGMLLDGEISVDQSALNGETAEVLKTPGKMNENDWSLENTHRVYRGSLVTQGIGIMRVGRVGKNTYYGTVADGVQVETRESPLKIRLSKLASQISHIGYLMAFLVAFTNLFFEIVVENNFSATEILSDLKNLPNLFSILLHAFSLMITVVVVAVPEGLPMMITVVLSSNMRRMQRDGVMVKKMVGIETAGSLNILFTDKTGTLTEGNLAVDSFFNLNKKYKNITALREDQSLFSALTLCIKYNTETEIGSEGVLGGNQTERALAHFFAKEDKPSASLLDHLIFDSNRKYASVTLNVKGRRLTLLKGAPEIVIGMCDKIYENNHVYTDVSLSELLNCYRQEAKTGKRVLAFAYKSENDEMYTFLSFVSLRDKLRKGVKEAVAEVKNAGVQIVMITGDGEETACAVAMECGILHNINEKSVISGAQLRSMTDQALGEVMPHIRVICRALPEDKMRLVRISQAHGFVVGMTGDGINDAPALKNADVGFAMGSGTDIAKSAADIVLLNNHFSSIGKTILYGRTIFRSIRKFVTFQLIMNLAACGVSFLGQFIGIENPITIVQMLWVNMIMDTLGGLAFAGEPPLNHYMLEKPKRREEAILTRDMLRQIFVTGGFTLLICMLYLKGLLLCNRFDLRADNLEFLTGFYALFIFIGLFNCIHTRSERLWIFHGIFENRPFLIILSLIAIIQIWIIYFGGALFRSVPLSVGQLLSVILLAFCVIPFDFLRRMFRKLNGK